MSNDIAHWYSKVGAGINSELPAQAIPLKNKNESFKRRTMDALERIGLVQFRDNRKFDDYYRMTRGEVSFTEMSELIPQLREVSELLDNVNLPTTIKHYDILGPVLNHLETIMIENKDKFHPMAVDEFSTAEREREQSRLLQNYIKETWEKELTKKLIENGVNPDQTEFGSEEEKQQYLQQLEQQREALTPPQIKEYMETKWTSAGIRWAKVTLESDERRKRLNELNRSLIKDFLRTGRMFKEYQIKYDSYEIKRWSPINTFYSKTTNPKYPQNGEYIGNIDFLTPSDFVNECAQFLTEKQKRKILNVIGEEDFDSGDFTLESAMNSNFQETHLVPHANYYDYNFLLDIQEFTGVPLAQRTIYKKDGTSETVKDYLPRRNNTSSLSYQYARYLNNDSGLRTDLITRTKAYWRSWKKVGFLCYITKEGAIDIKMVTEEILKDFLEDYGIKSLHSTTLEELRNNKIPNTIVWDYIPEIWYGEKASTSSTPLGEDLYFNVGPLPYQIKGDSALFDLVIPVASIVDENPSDKIMPFQNLHNIAINQMYNLMEKELGIFFLLDGGFLPSDIKEYGDTETSLMHMVNIIKGTGLFAGDGSPGNMRTSSFNQFTRVDMSLGDMIMQKQNQAEYFKMKAWEQFGLNQQVVSGDVVKHQTAEGVRQNLSATKSQTDYLFDIFAGFESRALEIHLAIAQYAQGDGRDITIEYAKDDLSTAFIKMSDPTLPLRWFRIMSVADSKKRKELEMVKNFMMTNNTMDMDIIELAKIMSSDSMSSLLDIAMIERKRKEIRQELERRHELEVIEKSSQAKKDEETFKWNLQEESNKRDRQNNIDVKRIDATGRAADNDANAIALDYINSVADKALLREKTTQELKLEEEKLAAEQADKKELYKLKEAELAIKLRDVMAKEKKIESDKFVAMVNKN